MLVVVVATETPGVLEAEVEVNPVVVMVLGPLVVTPDTEVVETWVLEALIVARLEVGLEDITETWVLEALIVGRLSLGRVTLEAVVAGVVDGVRSVVGMGGFRETTR